MSETKKFVCTGDVCLLKDENDVESETEPFLEEKRETEVSEANESAEISEAASQAESSEPTNEADSQSESDSNTESDSDTESESETESDYEEDDYTFIWLVIKDGCKFMTCKTQEEAKTLAENIIKSQRENMLGYNLVEENTEDEYRLYSNPCRNQFSFLFFSKLVSHVELRKIKLF